MCAPFQTKYKVLEKIGEGSFSEVLKCQDRQTGVLYAAKRLKKTYQKVEEILESPEVMAMRKISRHPNVLHMVESHYDTDGRVTLIFELMDMSLYDLMRNRMGRPITEMRVRSYVYQLLKGLEHLHKHGLFHRDIKPENVLLKGRSVKIGDLGSVRDVYSRPPYTEYISTRWYRSPECLLTGGYYGSKMDVWAAGCVFYELLTLEPLFPGENEVDQITKIHGILGTPHARLIAKIRRLRTRSADFYFPAKEGRGLSRLLPGMSSAGLEVLERMLVYDPENRSPAKRLLDHRYFADLRERETARQTRSSVLPNNHYNDPRQMVLAYFASDRQRRLRPLNTCQSQIRYRQVPNGLPIVPSCASVDAKCYDDFRNGKCVRKRQSLQNNVRKKWYDQGAGEYTNVRYAEKKVNVKPYAVQERRSFHSKDGKTDREEKSVSTW
ncbi:MAPK/MAK/MRK overlapping kinase-like [Copidosoma floridanum]|uniref:MAPK/MAK/MRK overlapping kinase-like n=1 Tax=Copidosoma floridanum TaxID=29053 RepID=UPI000C6FADAE|nr:MAPK/MAK/MRK overlapping kinase-like [Copidosoma floridanum]